LIDTDGQQLKRARWMDDFADGFGKVDPSKGFTVEIRVQVVKNTSDTRGFDFQVWLGDGFPSGRHYFVSITTSRVLLRGGKALVDGVDNHGSMHTYRIAVRSDGVAHMYRDGELLAMRPPGTRPDDMNRPCAYFQWGDGAGASETDALVEHVAYDLTGAYAP